jgi:hypothetical protein
LERNLQVERRLQNHSKKERALHSTEKDLKEIERRLNTESIRLVKTRTELER